MVFITLVVWLLAITTLSAQESLPQNGANTFCKKIADEWSSLKEAGIPGSVGSTTGGECGCAGELIGLKDKLEEVQEELVNMDQRLKSAEKTSDMLMTGEREDGQSPDLTAVVRMLARQLMLQQLFVEERIRSDGSSGLKQVRQRDSGTRPYHAESHTGRNIAAIHDHTNHIRTIGMGEFVGVLNGVEFRTRHNDYHLSQPSSTSGKYHARENIAFPEVPPEVTELASLDEQINELREWFHAWKEQDWSVRDYRKYFKAVLCYLEGAWTTTGMMVEEPFFSDRHHVDAETWFDLQDKIRFTSYSGSKDNLENLSYLPTTIMGLINGTHPVLAQWNYRIMCHPLSRDLPLDRLRVVDDLGYRANFGKTMAEMAATRAARFQLNPLNRSFWIETRRKYGLLDDLMGEIPGMDNYAGELRDYAFNLTSFVYMKEPGRKNYTEMNSARYHSWYRRELKDASGVQEKHRAFADETIFMAMTTQKKVAGMSMNVCTGRGDNKKCELQSQKWTYAVPLEVIYMTPLNAWNPHGVLYREKSDAGLLRTDGRNGDLSYAKAYNGSSQNLYYQTPAEFFEGDEIEVDPADTARMLRGVLDGDGQMQRMRASGTRIHFPNIPGLGVLRQRYPIMPLHGEGSALWKEMEALKDASLSPLKYDYLVRELRTASRPHSNDTDHLASGSVTLLTGPSFNEADGRHFHEIDLRPDEVSLLKRGVMLSVGTTQVDAHTHVLTILYLIEEEKYIYETCDGARRCGDGHNIYLSIRD